MTEEYPGPIVRLLSAERLVAFIRMSGTERGALTLHDHTIRIASALMPVICLLEIALRNAACERLRVVFATPDWLTSPPRPFAWRDSEGKKLVDAARQAQQASYAKLTESEKKRLDGIAFPNGVPRNAGHMRRSQARQRTLDVTHGQLVSQLTLFFWKRLFSADYEDALWKRGLKALFPDKTVGRSAVARRLEIIYKARNRIAHHEPIYGPRLAELIAAIEFLVVRLENRACDEGSALAKLTYSHRVNLKAVANETSVSFSPVVVDSYHVTGAVEV
jgi:hypothetical protein